MEDNDLYINIDFGSDSEYDDDLQIVPPDNTNAGGEAVEAGNHRVNPPDDSSSETNHQPQETTPTKAIVDSFLRARDEDKDFQRNLQHDKETQQDINGRNGKDTTPTQPPPEEKVKERWFLPLRDTEEPCFGFAPLNDIEKLPKDRFAHFLPRRTTPPPSTVGDPAKPQVSQANKRLIANFQPVATGQYTLYLRVRDACAEPATLRFTTRIVVRYTGARMCDTYYTTFTKSPNEGGDDWHYLKAESQFEVRAHRDIAQVNICIENDDKYDKFMHGELYVQLLELVPVGVNPRREGQVFLHADQPVLNIALDENRGIARRVVTSKNSNVVAALTVLTDSFTIHVMKKSDHQNWRDVSRVHAIKYDKCTDASKLPLELAISATGEYIAIYESPTIGDWQNGSIVPTSTFGVRIFRFSLNTTSDDYTIVRVADDGIQLDPVVPAPQELEDFKTIPSKLMNAVGYATFIGPSKDDKNASARFVFCNGLHLQVYKVSHDCLNYSHSIKLSNKTSPMCRIDAIEFMMASITTNMFVWAEDDRRNCSTWDLNNGTAMGLFEICGLYYNRISTSTVKAASNQNIIAIIGSDNSITTIDSSSGVPLSRHIFMKRSIEGIAFISDRPDMLLVQLRGEGEYRQTALVVDPLRLDVQFQAPRIPSPARSNAYGCLNTPKDSIAAQELGLVLQPDGEVISCYTVKTVVPSFGPNLHTDFPDSCQYELVFTSPASPQDADQIQMSCARQVDVYRKDRYGTQPPQEPVFSFIPEPWELHTAAKGQILPTGDRFVVYARWTIQVWSLPTETDPRCRLLFFWSAFDEKLIKRTSNGKTEMEFVLDYHVPFDAVMVQESKGQHTWKTRFQAIVVASGVVQVPIPNMPMYLDDYRMIVNLGIKSVRLLALMYTIVTSGYREQPPAGNEKACEYHASALLEFVNKFINYSRTTWPTSRRTAMRSTVLTYLLSDECPKDFGVTFITALLKYDKCNWVPRAEQAETLIEVAIRNKYTNVLQTLLDYCAKKANECHSAYLLPIESTCIQLSETFPDILQDFFRTVAYLPAQRHNLSMSDVTISNIEWEAVMRKPWSLLPRFAPPELEEYRSPILTFQLREHPTPRSEKRRFFNPERAEAIKARFDYKAFVVPFPSLLTLGKDSKFHQISGKNFFESPAMLAVLRYKWWQYGIYYWMVRYFVLVLYYSLFTTMTVTQMQRSGEIEGLQSLRTLFLSNSMKGVTIAGIVLGIFLFIFEAIQFFHDGPVRYLGTLFNYIDVFSIVACTSCFIKTFLENWGDQVSDGMPKQFAFTPYAIVAMYLHMIVELRVFRPMGIIVNIIVRIMLRIRAFFIVFILMVMAFSHSLVYLLYVFQTACTSDGVCERPKASKYPSSFFAAFMTTLFFLAGRYDPVDIDFENQKPQFFGILLIFYFVCFIVMLTVLIAQVSDAFTDAYKDGEQAWRRQLSETLSEAEMVIKLVPKGTKLIPTTWKHKGHLLPNMIIHMAPAQTASEYKEKLKEWRKDSANSLK